MAADLVVLLCLAAAAAAVEGEAGDERPGAGGGFGIERGWGGGSRCWEIPPEPRVPRRGSAPSPVRCGSGRRSGPRGAAGLPRCGAVPRPTC